MQDGGVKSNLIYENIYWPLALIFAHLFLFKMKSDEVGFTIKRDDESCKGD